MSFSDVEHFATVIAGCEAINSGDRSSGDARYAFAVLKLNVVDFGAHAGQESVVDKAKAGATKVVEWIKKFVESITKFIKELFSKTTKVDFDKASKNAAAAEKEKIKVNVGAYAGQLEAALKGLTSASESKNPTLGDTLHIDGIINNLNSAIKHVKEPNANSLNSNTWAAFSDLKIIVERANKALSSAASKGESKDLTAASNVVKQLTASLDKIGKVITRFNTDAEAAFNKINNKKD